MQGSSSKLNKKLSKNVFEKLETSQFYQYLGHSEGTFDQKLGIYFEKRASA